MDRPFTLVTSAVPYPVKEAFADGEQLKFSVRKLYLIALIMASMAGYINSAMLIEFGLPVSQMTGVTSRLSDSLIHFDWSGLWIPLMILCGFLGGAFLSGLIIGQARYNTSARYGHALLLNSAILAAATVFSFIQSEVSLLLSAIACGLQNALVASYRGLQLRTTHMTGTVTDLGVHLAHVLKSGEAWPWQANLLIVLLLSFLVGGVLGILAYREFPNWSLIVPAGLMALLGVVYLKNFYRKSPRKTQ